MPRKRSAPRTGFLREHSLSLILAAVLLFLVVMYVESDPRTHLGTFYGNAIADWLGVFVFVIATKYLSRWDRVKAAGLHREFTSGSDASSSSIP